MAAFKQRSCIYLENLHHLSMGFIIFQALKISIFVVATLIILFSPKDDSRFSNVMKNLQKQYLFLYPLLSTLDMAM